MSPAHRPLHITFSKAELSTERRPEFCLFPPLLHGQYPERPAHSKHSNICSTQLFQFGQEGKQHSGSWSHLPKVTLLVKVTENASPAHSGLQRPKSHHHARGKPNLFTHFLEGKCLPSGRNKILFHFSMMPSGWTMGWRGSREAS